MMSAPTFFRDALLSVYPFLNQHEFHCLAACVNHEWKRAAEMTRTRNEFFCDFSDGHINMDRLGSLCTPTSLLKRHITGIMTHSHLSPHICTRLLCPQMAHLTSLEMSIDIDRLAPDDLLVLFPPALQDLRIDLMNGPGTVHTDEEVKKYFHHLMIGIGTAIHLTSLSLFLPCRDDQHDLIRKLYIPVPPRRGPRGSNNDRRVTRPQGYALPVDSLKPIGQLKELRFLWISLPNVSFPFHLLESDINAFRSLPSLTYLKVPMDGLSFGWLAAEPTPTTLTEIELPNRIDSTVGPLLTRFPQFTRYQTYFWHELHDCSFFAQPSLSQQLTTISISHGFNFEETIDMFVLVSDLCQAIGECTQLKHLGFAFDGLTTQLLTKLFSRLLLLESFSLCGAPDQQATLKNLDFLTAPTSAHLKHTLKDLFLSAPIVPQSPPILSTLFHLTNLTKLRLGWMFDPPLDPLVLSQLKIDERKTTLQTHPEAMLPFPKLTSFVNYTR